MLNDIDNISNKFIHDGSAVKEALKSLDFDRVRFIFQTLLKNVPQLENHELRFACVKGMSEVALKLLDQPKVRENAHA